MEMITLWSLQVEMFLLVIAGALLAKKSILKADAKGILTDLVLCFILPANIINSFRMKFELSVLGRFLLVFIAALLMQGVCYLVSRYAFRNKPKELERVMRYCTIVSNSGFLGLPIISEIYGPEGVMYASIAIIPTRIMMWSAGIACFTESPDLKTVVRKLVFHPCLVAVYIGLLFMVLQEPAAQLFMTVPALHDGAVGVGLRILWGAIDKAMRAAGGCTTTLTMLLIGMMMTDIRAKELIDRNTIEMAVMRLGILPGLALLLATLLGLDPLLKGILVLITGMPAGSTSAILASKYGCDHTFAARCVIVTTLLSMLTIPLWRMLL